ncbi:MAG TPA: thioredoxin domain-containing protein [Rhodanobacteraceae bacterium]|nr:thioredoxin domain-containing protein [Rhodanobacteraceae bacterium]
MRNELIHASSPYLRQHAVNPVHWQEWNTATLAHAKRSDTPILLSIGYSACHWCHVMAHECFEDATIAGAMNALFVNIKVDREERPDLDRVYQLAHQALTGRGGGWPLTVFIDPQDLAPFFAGTYFPPQPRHGLPAFGELLQRVRAYYDGQREQLREQGGQLREWLARTGTITAGEVPDPSLAKLAIQRIAARFDPDNGGTRGAPKFPHTGELELLLDADTTARAMAIATLRSMAARGLQDHLDGGFFRYCVDATWTIPHFEKMLYDNALLLPLFARVAGANTSEHDARAADANQAGDDAHKASMPSDPACAQAAHGIVAWLRREMTTRDGAFFSALDADSADASGHAEEGAYYLWTREQVRNTLPADEAAAIEAGFGLDAPPNFEGRAWHLVKTRTLEQIAQDIGRTLPETGALLASARGKLLQARSSRPRPATDDKILTSWNALTIAGLLRAARALRIPEWSAMAERALDALRATAWVDGALYANAVGDAGARIPAFLDDHAFLLDTLLEMLQHRWRDEDLAWAIALADALLECFEDKQDGAFFFAAAAHATPLHNPKTFMDEALPSGNGVAAKALLRLGHLLGETRWLDAAGRCLRAGSAMLRAHPDACPAMLRALREFHTPRSQVVIRCNEDERDEWRDALADAIARDDRIDAFVIPSTTETLPGVLAQRKPCKGGVAYVCSGTSCRAPLHSPRELAEILRAEPLATD